jgi:NADH dehydrogenase
MKPPKKRILILGGGFGGVYAALRLEKLLAGKLAKREAEITLVSRDNFFLFTPMLHEVAASDLEITNIVNPLRKLLQHTQVVVGQATRIDLPNQRVSIQRGSKNKSDELIYDHLVLALGSHTNYFNLPGLEEFSVAMKTLPDAVQLRAQIIQHLEDANSECILNDRRSLLTFVVAGGGFAGVETVASINDFVREALKFYPNLKEEMLRVVLVHPGAVILPELGEELGRYAQTVLARQGVEILLNTRVTGMSEKQVTLGGADPLPASTLVWTAGTIPNLLLSDLPCARERNRVVVNQFLHVPEWPSVWAIGDCAHVPDRGNPGKCHPPTAQHAIREGMLVADNIAASLSSRPLKAFSFKTIGLLASIGRRTGVARIFGFNLSGFFAWWLWRTIYLSKLPGLDKKVRVAFEWTLDLVFHKDVCTVNDQPRRSSQNFDSAETAHGRNGAGQQMTSPEREPRPETSALEKLPDR